ncbi:hypothetical protein [Piscinibacter sakaiensis]|uniref:Lipoprotein n=1 Tax=Piscinibacter sakaiensis TaxID=1547922 RepID=A0A0K8P652_PISS1|nr:hypothetical protein [Piscinibacter sakaiensis]GAP38081.1 hypothetical protein ISF6_4275 [Piscinibacter sakaiensis]
MRAARRSGRRRAPALALLALAAAGVGCMDGYPTEDVPRRAAAQMSQQERLDGLNALGRAPHLAQRWRYALGAGCALQLELGDGGRRERRALALQGAEIRTRVDGASGWHEVTLRPAQPLRPSTAGAAGAMAEAEAEADADARHTVLATPKWTDAVQAHGLLTHLEHGCGAAGAPRPPAGAPGDTSAPQGGADAGAGRSG